MAFSSVYFRITLQYYILPVLFSISVCTLFAQKGGINGRINDENNSSLTGVIVQLLPTKDSTPSQSTTTDTAGGYVFSGLEVGRYMLRFRYLGYLQQDSAVVLGWEGLKLGPIALKPDMMLLKEVQITSNATPIIIRNDTIFYRTASFATREYASILQLLKQLPGFEVDQDGVIRSNGKVVENILVDGKRFFQNDQATTLKLLSNAIETIEVYDQGSLKADFTGVDDGIREKTINLVLKEDRKRGWFGELGVAGGGSEVGDPRYESTGNFNRFTPKNQYAVVVGGNNLNPSGDGIARNGNAGLNVNKSLKKGGSLYTNYEFGVNDAQNTGEVNRQIFMEENTLYTKEKSKSTSGDALHNLSFNTNFAKDTTYNFSLGGNINLKRSYQNLADSSWSSGSNGAPLNAGFRENKGKDDGDNFSLDMGYNTRLRKKGTFLSLVFGGSRSSSNAAMNSVSSNTYYENGRSRDVFLDQEMQQAALSTGINFIADYTLPLNPKSLLQANVSYGNFRQTGSILVHDMLQGEKLKNDSLSRDFLNQTGASSMGLAWQYRLGDWNFVTRVAARYNSLSGELKSVSGLPPTKRSYWNLTPSLNLNRSFKNNQSLNIDYMSMTEQPSLEQLQPVTDNSDPLNIREGNPSLEPSINHTGNISYNFNQPEDARGLLLNSGISYIQNQIIETIRIDENFVRYYRPQNSAEAFKGNVNLSFFRNIPKLKCRFFGSLLADYQIGQVMMGDRLNKNTAMAYGQSFNVKFSPKAWVEFNINANFSQNTVTFDLDKIFNQKYQNSSCSTSVSLDFPRYFSFNTSLNISQSKGRSSGFNQVIPIWNAGIGRNFLKNESLKLRIEATDLLNRNVGITRSIQLNSIEDRKGLVLRRYFLLRVTYLLV